MNGHRNISRRLVVALLLSVLSLVLLLRIEYVQRSRQDPSYREALVMFIEMPSFIISIPFSIVGFDPVHGGHLFDRVLIIPINASLFYIVFLVAARMRRGLVHEPG